MPELPADPATRDALATMQRLASELRLRQPAIQRRMDYYRGQHPLVYASDEFAHYMGDRFAGFSDNWCPPVVQTVAERIDVRGIRLDDDAVRPDEDLARAWRRADCERGFSEAVTVMLAAARSYALVWADPDDETEPVVTWERPDQAIVAYRPETGRPVSALKLWADEDAGYEYATLYTRDTVWKFQRPGVAQLVRYEPRPAVDPTGGWEPRQPPGDDTWPIPNPMGMIPLVELRNQTLLDDAPISDIDGVIAMQDAINLVWAYLMNALDYATLPQRVVTGADMPKVPVLDATGQPVGERPLDLDTLVQERILWIPDADARTAEWSAARLDVFSAVIERAIEHIAAQTRTPPHYLIGKLVNLSAEALTAADAGQVSKAGERITYATPGVRRVFALMAKVLGDDRKASAALSGQVVWKDIQYRSLAQLVDALVKLRQIGMPLEWVMEQYGLEPHEVQRVTRMRDEELAADPIGAIAAEMGRATGPTTTPTGQTDTEIAAVDGV